MIFEVAHLDVRPDRTAAFEQAFQQAAPLIAATPGYRGHQLQRCLETRNRYLLLVGWETLENHTRDFRESERYGEWRRLLHHFYGPFPTVEHYEPCLKFGADADIPT